MAIYGRASIEARKAGLRGKFVLSHAAPQLSGKKQPLISRFYRPSKVSDMQRKAEASAEGGDNVWFYTGLMREDLKLPSRGGEDDIAAGLALVVEEDADTGKFVTLPVKTKPTITMKTSSDPALNRQYHYVLSRALPPEEYKDFVRLAYQAVGGDSCNGDPTHIWRMGGTWNYPDRAKIARGRPLDRQRVEVLEISGELADPDALRVEFLEMLAARGESFTPKPADASAWVSGGLEDPEAIIKDLESGPCVLGRSVAALLEYDQPKGNASSTCTRPRNGSWSAGARMTRF